MAMTARHIADDPLILSLIQQQSAAMHEAYRANSRMSAVFATQQRWLLGHAALAIHFRSVLSGDRMLTLSRFLDVVAEHTISSRNTADAFVKEMLHYGYARPLDAPFDRRMRPMTISPATAEAIHGWALMHLVTLDRLDNGNRTQTFMAEPSAIARLQPEICAGLLVDPAIRQPQNTFSLFTWLNNGGVIMDWLVIGLGDLSADGMRYPTSIASVGDMATWFKLSRSHLSRKLREAESMGSLGWMGKRGASPMWVSAGFVAEMIDAQATKLAVIDAAFERCFAG